jgi:hypothetical protein
VAGEDVGPVVLVFDGDEFAPDGGAVGVEFGVFDAHFSHVAGGGFFAVDLDGEGEVFEEGFALFVDGGWGREGFAAEEGGEFVEDPGVADGAAGDPDAVEVGGLVHAEGVLGGEDVAGAEEGDVVGGAGFEGGEEVPVGGAGVFLFDGSAVDGDGGEAEGDGFVEDFIEPVGGLGGVVEGAAEFDAEGEVADGVSDGAHDGDGGGGVGEEVAAAAAAHDFFDGAGEVEVDDIKTGFDEELGGGGEFVGFGAHELAGDGVVFIAEDGALFAAASAAEEDLVEEGFGDGVGAAAAASDDAHGHVGVAGEAGLHGGDGESEGADAAGAEGGDGEGCGHEGFRNLQKGSVAGGA